ncbi:MAG: hypothetical protein PHY48_03560 [Candidatus Cloacimonetes bacterium]|nr:hypothetical protein [Candidatus Cloacimonadota bacterium]
MKYWIISFLLVLVLLGACSVSKSNQTSVVKGDYGMLRLVGDPIGREVSLDGNIVPLEIKKKTNIFELKTGTYALEIRVNGSVQLSQKLFITNGQTNEIKMP